MTKEGVCDVCLYADGNSEKKIVTYCRRCKAWICQTCKPNYFKRALASINKTLANLK